MQHEYSRAVIAAVALFLGCTSTEAATNGQFARKDAAAAELATQMSEAPLADLAMARGLSPADLTVMTVQVDELSMAHVRVQQRINGVPVVGAEAIVHLNTDGSLFVVTDDLLTGVRVDTAARLSSKNAVDLALQYEPQRKPMEAPTADLWVLRHEGEDHLVWRVQWRHDGDSSIALPVSFVDAHTGKKIFGYDNFQTTAVPATGKGRYNGTVSFMANQVGSVFYLENTNRRVGTFDCRNTTSTYRFTDADNVWVSAIQAAGVDAHFGTLRTHSFYQDKFGRIGLDGRGGPIYYTSADNIGVLSSRVHYGINCINAGWDGRLATYCDGDGQTFGPLVALDIVAHELTHGVTQFTANLLYFGESGAMNECVSDVFGAMVERNVKGETTNTWRIGEDAYTPSRPGDALRYLDNPHAASNKGFTADDDPDHYIERYTGAADNGGVHINSGIGNKAFFLLAKGGAHHRGGSMAGIGADAAMRIWYLALTAYMTSGSSFLDARRATVSAATALYGATSPQVAATRQAWCLVGVGTLCP